MSQSVTPTSKPVGTTELEAIDTDRTTVADIVSEHQRSINEWNVYSEVARLSEDTIHRVGE